MSQTNAIKDIDFFRGGNATFTVSKINGPHYTFRIRYPYEDKPFFVGLLAGPDNISSYIYLGIYDPEKLEVRLTNKSKFRNDSVPIKTIRWAIRMIAEQKELPEGYSIQHNGRCSRCERILTTPKSIERGIGPECIKRMRM